MSCLRKCPRCGEHSFEKLNTYSHCAGCLYFEDYWGSPETDFYNALKTLEELDEAGLSHEVQDEPIVESDDQQFENTLKGA